MINEWCVICGGEGWVCERHPHRPWPEGCDCSAGMPCECNPEGQLPPGFRIIESVERGLGQHDAAGGVAARDAYSPEGSLPSPPLPLLPTLPEAEDDTHERQPTERRANH